MSGLVVLAGHAYAGAVIGTTRHDKVRALVYVAALAPDEGETIADVFYRNEPHPMDPKLAPDENGLLYLPDQAFPQAFAQNASSEDLALLAAVQRRFRPHASAFGSVVHCLNPNPFNPGRVVELALLCNAILPPACAWSGRHSANTNVQ